MSTTPSPEEQDIPAAAYRELIMDRLDIYFLDNGPTQRCRLPDAFSDVRPEDLDKYIGMMERKGRIQQFKQGGRWCLDLTDQEREEVSQPYRRVTPDQQRELLGKYWDPAKFSYKSQENSRRAAKTIPASAVTLNPDGSCDIVGGHGTYHTTLQSCTCDDFYMNKHSAAPCKHIYRLASELLSHNAVPDQLPTTPPPAREPKAKASASPKKAAAPQPQTKETESDSVKISFQAGLEENLETLQTIFAASSIPKQRLMLSVAAIPDEAFPALQLALMSLLVPEEEAENG